VGNARAYLDDIWVLVSIAQRPTGEPVAVRAESRHSRAYSPDALSRETRFRALASLQILKFFLYSTPIERFDWFATPTPTEIYYELNCIAFRTKSVFSNGT
jgi:hypothetical protein